MLQCHYHHTLFPHFFPLSKHHYLHPQNPAIFIASLRKPTSRLTRSALPGPSLDPWLVQLSEFAASGAIISPEEDGPIELPLSPPSLFATTDEPTPLQVATSLLLTGAIVVFLFRSIRRRAQRAKERRFRSSGVKKTLKEEALDTLKAMEPTSVEGNKPPSPVQALLGGISAGVIAVILYKFTTTIEAALNRQAISDSFSVRQITITIRTIISGLCYLATFVFGINSVGLVLYSAQLAINSFTEGSSSGESGSKDNMQSGSPNSTSESPTNSAELNSSQGDQNPDNTQE